MGGKLGVVREDAIMRMPNLFANDAQQNHRHPFSDLVGVTWGE